MFEQQLYGGSADLWHGPNYGKQEPAEDIGVDTFEFWCPQRRPGGQNLAMRLSPAIRLFTVQNLRNGVSRPVEGPNAWVASPGDVTPAVALSWPRKKRIRRAELSFDGDFDHPLETVIMHNPEMEIPFCVKEYVLCDDRNERIHYRAGNHQTRNVITFDEPVYTSCLSIHVKAMNGPVSASLFEVRCYE